jgi:chemotaxis signal transduction protein
MNVPARAGNDILLVTFRANHEENFALFHEAVSEVIEAGAIEAVPKAPPEIEGLVNHRGKILTVIDFDALVEGEPLASAMADAERGGKEDARRTIIIFSGEFSHLGILIRSEVGVVRVRNGNRGLLPTAHKLYNILEPPIVEATTLYNMISPEKIILTLNDCIAASKFIILESRTGGSHAS